MLCCIPLFIKFGFWQYHKAERERALQALFDQAQSAAPVALPADFPDAASLDRWRYRHVKVTGSYLPQYQLLLDNQVMQDQAGYHVITPLRVQDGAQHVLVDRGWVPVGADRRVLPQIETPAAAIEVSGILWQPPDRFFSLGGDDAADTTKWNQVWQYMDMKKYRQSVPFAVLPMVIRLDADNESSGGYARQWPRPAERIATHVSYAYQWFGFAVAAGLIWLVAGFKRRSTHAG